MQRLLVLAGLMAALVAWLVLRSEPHGPALESSNAVAATSGEGSSLLTGARQFTGSGAEAEPTGNPAGRRASALIESEAHGAEPPPPALVFGQVLEPDGTPASDALIYARAGGWYSIVPLEIDATERGASETVVAKSDAEGRFQFLEGLEAGSHLALSVVHEGCAVERILRRPFPSTPHAAGVIQLRPGLRISGTIEDSSGRPVGDAVVLLAANRGVAGSEGSFPGQGHEIARTNSAGAFHASTLAPGKWHLLFEAPGLCVAERQGFAHAGDAVQLDVVTLQSGHTLTGRILNGPQERLGELWIEARSESLDTASLRRGRRATPQPSGHFRIPGLHAQERVRVRVIEQGPEGGWVPVSEVPQVVVPSNTSDLELTWGVPLALRAQVVDATGEPIESYQAFAHLGYFGGTHPIGGDGPGETETLHPGGQLHASGLRLYSEEQITVLRIESVGFEDFEQTVPGLTPGQSVDLGTLELTPAPLLHIRVVDPAGAPVAMAALELQADDTRTKEATTDSDGLALINAASNRPHVLTARHPSWALARIEVPPVRGSRTDILVRLEPGCTLTARVLDTNGDAAAGQQIVARLLLNNLEPDPSARQDTKDTDQDGTATWHNLPCGTYRVERVVHSREWRAPGTDENASQVVPLTPGSVAIVELDAPLETTVVGKVRDGDGPISTATITLRPIDDRGGRLNDRGTWRTRFSGISNSFGEFQFERIPHGLYDLEVEHDPRAMIAVVPFPIPPVSQPVDIVLESSSIAVRVIDDGGRPVPGATVEIEPTDPRLSGWNNGRRAWTDERGDLQQAWFQNAIHERTTDAEGWALFEGCTPGQEFSLLLQGRWFGSTGFTGFELQANESRKLDDPLVARSAGELVVHASGGGPQEWRLVLTGPGDTQPGFPAAKQTHEKEFQRGSASFKRCVAGPSGLALQRRAATGDWEQVAQLTFDLPGGRSTEVDANLDAGTLELRAR